MCVSVLLRAGLGEIPSYWWDQIDGWKLALVSVLQQGSAAGVAAAEVN